MSKTTEEIGKRVRKIRNSKGISIRDLERESGVSRGIISMLENGKLSNIGVENLNKIAEGLKVDLVELIPKSSP